MNELVIVSNAETTLQQGRNIQSAMERFIDYIAVQDITVKSYAVALRCFADWLNENGIEQPSRDDIKAYQKYLESPHPRRQRIDRPDSAATGTITFADGTQARYLRAVKMFFKWTAQEKAPYFYPNIAENIPGTSVSMRDHKRDALQKDGAMTVLEAIDRSTDAGKRDYAMILLSITCGLRIVELQRAKIKNMEMLNKENVLFIQGKGHRTADEYKKLTPEVYAAIKEYLSTRDKLFPDSPLFASTGNRSKGQALTEPSISRIIKERLKAAGFDTHRISAHSLRHSSVTFLLEAGATLQEAQHHARHASPETTGIYAHNIKQEKQHTEQRVYDFLFGKETNAATEAADCFKRMTAEQQEQALMLLKAIAK